MTNQQDTTANTIRPLSAEDLEAVIALDTSIAGTSRRGFFEKRLKAAVERPRDYVYVGLYDGDLLVGFAMARLIDGEFGKPGARASLDAISVAPALQSHGAGHKLLAAVKEILSHKEVVELESQVGWSDRSLLGFLGDTGFKLAPRMVLRRKTDEFETTNSLPPEAGSDDFEVDHSSPDGDDAGALSRDRVPVRSMKAADIAAIIRIDHKLSGVDHATYFQHKQQEVLYESGVRVSLVAELDGFPVGYIMARVDFGEFGHTMTEAVMDAFGVDPGFQGQGVGRALMSQLIANLAILRVEHLRTEAAWNDVAMIAFFSRSNFAPAQRISLVCAI